ncbi:PucR family transcriptional regulator ligand-binding domain-containing protein [Lachnospiraceae bacterium 48-42]
MGFTVKDMLGMEIFGEAVLLSGTEGLVNEILGATIIEAPDIVKFINGGEVLLTGFYAFQSCSIEEFNKYIDELSKKKVSAIAVKRKRNVEHIEEKLEIMLRYAKRHVVPVFEVSYELSFREMLKLIMERLFSEEVRRLKYFKTTHDNFTALSLSFNSMENGIQRILDVLEKLIGNPVALFNQNMDCLASTEEIGYRFRISEQAEAYQPQFYSNYTYLRQRVVLPGEDQKECEQYLVRLKVMYNRKMYLAITASRDSFGDMDDIAVENAVTALKQELFRQHSIEELEERFQNDSMNRILSGKLHTRQEIERDIKLLGIPMEADYRVLVMKLWNEGAGDFEKLNDGFHYVSILRDAVVREFGNIRIRDDVDKVVIIQQIRQGQKQEEYRRELKDAVDRIQKRIVKKNKSLKVLVGVGKEVAGVMNLAESFNEAGDSLEFIVILGEKSGDSASQIMFFTDMGIFKLLCKLEDTQELYDYIPESLQKLFHYKKQQRQDLIMTLNTYLDRNQNLTKTAQELFIHYKTAAYRIDRITEITGIDFDNPSEVLAVRIGLIVHKMIENAR